MKRAVALSSLFIFVFAIVAGVTAIATKDAHAVEICTAGCIYELYCDTFTGPKCTDPEQPHYLWAINGFCLDGNPDHVCFGYFAGCCNK